MFKIRSATKRRTWGITFTLSVTSFIGLFSLVFNESFIRDSLLPNTNETSIAAYKTLTFLFALFIIVLLADVRKGISIREYFSLNLPKFKDSLVWIGGFIVYDFTYSYYFGSDGNSQYVQGHVLYLIVLLSNSLLPAAVEEMFYCGFIFKCFEERNLMWLGIIVTIVMRLLTHQRGRVEFMVGLSIFSVYAIICTWKTKSIVLPIAAHFLHNLSANSLILD